MILVTLGTQDKSFTRILDEIQKLIDNNIIQDRVVVQAGFTKYKSNNMKIFDLVDREQFSELIKECSLLITHGGVGSILTGLKNNKVVIACPRLAKYKEHLNDHQVQIVNNFSAAGYILKYDDGDDLAAVIEKSQKFKPKKYVSNTKNIINIIEKYIKEN